MSDSERGFYYDGEFCGAVDMCHHASVEISVEACHLITETHLLQTWNRLKRRYPLLSARIEELANGEVRFVVEEDRLDSVIETEFAFRRLPESELPRILEEYHNGPRKLSRNLMANVEFIIHPNTSGRDPGSMRASILLNSNHCTTDGTARHSALKDLLNFIVSSPDDHKVEVTRNAQGNGVTFVTLSNYSPGREVILVKLAGNERD